MQQGAKVEASTLSRSTSQVVDAAQRKDIINGRVSIIDRLFPLSDEILKSTSIPQAIFLLVCLYACIELIVVSYWCQFPGYYDYDQGIDGVLKIFFQMTYFCDLTGSTTSLTIRFAITTAFTVLCFGMLTFQQLTYAKTRRFVKWTLYVTRALFEFVPILCLVPLGNFVGQSFNVLLETKSTLSIVYFVMGIIYFILFIFAQYLQTYLWSRSTYITNSPTSCWDGFVMFIFPVAGGFFSMLAWVVQAFTDWMSVVLIAFKVLFDLYLCYESTYLPFVQYHTNTLLATLYTTQFGLDIIGIVKYFVQVDPLYSIIVMFILIIGSAIVWMFVTKAIVKKVKSRLDLSALEDVEATSDAMPVTQGGDQYIALQDAQRRQLFLNCKIQSSAKRAELYMRIGLTNCCPLFYDWSLAKFISEFYANNTALICRITQFLSYFPCESRLLNYFFILSVQKTGLKVGDRFMLYQVHRVKGLRQSSASSEITDKLMEMKGLAQRGMTAVRSFWEQVPKNPSVMYDIRHSTKSTTDLFNECLDKWPNNSRLVEDFSSFLIECASDFSQGLKMKHRAELIEQGKNFVVDLPFRSLVRCYPMYLKKGIMDVKGNFLNRGAKPQGGRGNASLSGSSNSSNSQVSSSVLNGELDAEIEDQLGRICFSQHKLRLAFQRALDGRKSANNKRLKVMSAIAMISAAGLIIFLFAYFYNKFQVRADNMERQSLLNQFRYGFDASVVTIVTHWARKSKLISDELFGNESTGIAMRSPKTNNHNLQFSDVTHKVSEETLEGFNMSQVDYNMFDETQRWITLSRDNLVAFASSMVLLASSGTNVHTMMEVMVDRVVEIHFCDGEWNGDPEKDWVAVTNANVLETLKTALTYGLIELANLSQAKFGEAQNYYHLDKGLCECFQNVESMYGAFDALTASLTQDQVSLKNQMSTSNWILMGCLCGAYLIVIAPFLFAFLGMTLKELNTLIKMMADIDRETREQAAKPFKASLNSDQDSLNETKNDHSISPAFLYGNVAFFLIMVMIVFIVTIVMAEIRNTGFLQLNQWLYYGISRGNYMLEIICFAILDILLTKEPGRTRMLNATECERLARSILTNLVSSNTKILRGSAEDGLAACVGENAELDKLHFEDDCHGTLNLGGFHDTYRCASLDRGINLFDVLITEILDQPTGEKLLDPDGSFYHAFHLMNAHLMDNTYVAAQVLTQLASNSIASFQTLISAFAFGGIAVLLLAYAIFIWNLQNLDTAFEGSLQLLKRLPPLHVVSNQALLNYLLNKKGDKGQGKMTASKAVIYNAQDAVICLSRGESIEVVNKTVSGLFGYTPEQLLGQSISAILQQEENGVLYEQMELMRNGEAALTYECHLVGRTDDDQTIPVKVTLLGIKDEKSKAAQSFVVIMRDETFSLKKKEEAEAAKKKSEDLLYQILPRDIVVRLNQGETDISFVVPSASVVFVDIVKFSDYAATLTPAQIMENLSAVFAAFDICCAKQNLMTKIKLIGDVYMAAANLFTPDEPPANHASQVIQFGLDCLAALEEVNTQLDANLAVRIGVNTDGPLIAGVLGTDKPVFDIIGDTINVSSRLQSTCIPGTVQISQTTFDAVSGMSFNIEQRGEIFLKGKGKRMAYVVRPTDSSSFFVSADSSQASLPPLNG